MHVLVVEDDDDVARMVTWALRLDGHTVDHHSTGDVILNGHQWDAALIDWMLPEETGCVLAQRLRAERPWMRVVIWTAYPAGAREDCKCEGCVILTKPAPMSEVIDALGLL